MLTLHGELQAFQTQIEGPLSDLENRLNEILTDVDQYADDVVNLLSRAAMFVVAQAGWGFSYDFRRRVFTAILGVLVTQRFQRTRWRDGRSWLWLGVRKQTGRGEGSSGLAFDQIVDVPPAS